MWPGKLVGEDAALVDACSALCQAMAELGVAVDGGKDSLSMAARVGSQMIKAPSTVVITASVNFNFKSNSDFRLPKSWYQRLNEIRFSSYAPCPDVRLVVTPDLKCGNNEESVLLLVDLSAGKCRLGGSSLAQCYNQLSDSVPDLDNPLLLTKAFNCTQKLIKGSRQLRFDQSGMT